MTWDEFWSIPPREVAAFLSVVYLLICGIIELVLVVLP